MYARSRQPILPHTSTRTNHYRPSTHPTNTNKYYKPAAPYSRPIQIAVIIFLLYSLYIVYTSYLQPSSAPTQHTHNLYDKRADSAQLSAQHDQSKFLQQQQAQHTADDAVEPTQLQPVDHKKKQDKSKQKPTPVTDTGPPVSHQRQVVEPAQDSAQTVQQPQPDPNSVQSIQLDTAGAQQSVHSADNAAAAQSQQQSGTSEGGIDMDQHNAALHAGHNVEAVDSFIQELKAHNHNSESAEVLDRLYAEKFAEVKKQAEFLDQIILHANKEAMLSDAYNVEATATTAKSIVHADIDRKIDLQLPYRKGWYQSARLCSNAGFDASQNYKVPLLQSLEQLATQGITCFNLDVFCTADYTTAVQFDQPPVPIQYNGKDTGMHQPKIHNTNAAQTLYVGRPETVMNILHLMDSAEKFTAEQLDKHLRDNDYGGTVAKLDDVLTLLDKHIHVESIILSLHGSLQTMVAHYITVGSLIAQHYMLHVRTFLVVADVLTAQRIKKHSKWLELALPVDENMPEELQSIVCKYDPQLTVEDRYAATQSYSMIHASVHMVHNCAGNGLDLAADQKNSHNFWFQLRIARSIGVYTYMVDTVEQMQEIGSVVDGMISNNVLLLDVDPAKQSTG